MSYDPKFRERAVKYEETHGIAKTCEAFGISRTTVERWRAQYREIGSLANKPLNRGHKKIDLRQLLKDVRDYPGDFFRKRGLKLLPAFSMANFRPAGARRIPAGATPLPPGGRGAAPTPGSRTPRCSQALSS